MELSGQVVKLLIPELLPSGGGERTFGLKGRERTSSFQRAGERRVIGIIN